MMLFGKDLKRGLVVVAEVGVNHEGDVHAASKLIRLAADAGADAETGGVCGPGRVLPGVGFLT